MGILDIVTFTIGTHVIIHYKRTRTHIRKHVCTHAHTHALNTCIEDPWSYSCRRSYHHENTSMSPLWARPRDVCRATTARAEPFVVEQTPRPSRVRCQRATITEYIKNGRYHTPSPTRYRRRSNRTTRSTSLRRHSFNGTARCRSRALVDYQDTLLKMTRSTVLHVTSH